MDNNLMFYLAQGIGFIAIAVSFFIYLQNSRRKMLICKLITDVLWVLHHVFISSHTAAMIASVSVFRELVFSADRKKWARNKIWLLVFSALSVSAGVLTWSDVYSIFPPIASILLVAAFWNKNKVFTRIFGFISSVCMFVYGWHYYSVPTIVNEVLMQFSIIIAVIREKNAKFMQSEDKCDSIVSNEIVKQKKQ